MPVYSSSFYGTAKLEFVLTQSTTNGPIINFSASIDVYNSGSNSGFGIPGVWVTSSRSIKSWNSMTLVSSSLTGSNLLNFIDISNRMANVDFNSIADDVLVKFVSGSSITGLFYSSSITLLGLP